MTWVIAAVLAPGLGPVLYRALHPRPWAVRLVDGFVYLAVPLLVAWQVIPHALADRSAALLVALGAGILIPTLVERASHALAKQTDNLALLVGLSGILLHAGLEGTALAPGSEGVELPFALAVTLHRVPVGLVIWWLIRPRFGIPLASAAVASVMAATLLGFLVGAELVGGAHHAGFELYQAFVSGSLVHVVFHQGRHDHDHGGGTAHTHGRGAGNNHRHHPDRSSGHRH